MTKLILDYSKWRCGGDKHFKLGFGSTCLLNNEGFMCCLGQFSKQLNSKLTDQDIINYGTPAETHMEISELSIFDDDLDDYEHGYVDTLLSTDAMEINDNQSTSPEQKIEQLKELFAKHNFEIEVINKP